MGFLSSCNRFFNLPILTAIETSRDTKTPPRISESTIFKHKETNTFDLSNVKVKGFGNSVYKTFDNL